MGVTVKTTMVPMIIKKGRKKMKKDWAGEHYKVYKINILDPYCAGGGKPRVICFNIESVERYLSEGDWREELTNIVSVYENNHPNNPQTPRQTSQTPMLGTLVGKVNTVVAKGERCARCRGGQIV